MFAEGLEIFDYGFTAGGPGDDVVDVEDDIGVGGGGSAAVDAFEIVALEDLVAKAHRGGARSALDLNGMSARMRRGFAARRVVGVSLRVRPIDERF